MINDDPIFASCFPFKISKVYKKVIVNAKELSNVKSVEKFIPQNDVAEKNSEV